MRFSSLAALLCLLFAEPGLAQTAERPAATPGIQEPAPPSPEARPRRRARTSPPRPAPEPASPAPAAPAGNTPAAPAPPVTAPTAPAENVAPAEPPVSPPAVTEGPTPELPADAPPGGEAPPRSETPPQPVEAPPTDPGTEPLTPQAPANEPPRQGVTRPIPPPTRPRVGAPAPTAEATTERRSVQPQSAAKRPPARRLTWRSVFEREPLGFSRHTLEYAAGDLATTVRSVSSRPQDLWSAALRIGIGFWLGLLVLVLGVSTGLLTERLSPPGWRKIWLRARRAGPRNRMWQAAVAVLQRAALPILALAGWSFGGALAGAGDAPAVQLLEWLLLLWLAYRFLDEVARLTSERLIPREETREFYGSLHGLLVFAALWLAGWVLMDATGYRSQVVSLWIFLGHLTLVLGTFGLLARRDRWLDLLPPTEHRTVAALRRAFRAIYLPVLYASLVLALLWVFGYRTLAAVALGRSWAVIGICLMAYLVYRAAVALMRRMVAGDPEHEDTAAEAVAAARRLFGLIAGLIALSLSLQALGVAEGLREALQHPWINTGSIRITGRAVWGSIVIVVGLLMASRFAQAMLAYRAYPRLGVGAGEAYALNRLLHYVLLSIGALLVLNRLGLSPESLALVLGGLSVGIGFGLQDIARNIASGLILLIGRQVRKGDVITVDDRMGTIQSVNLRSTVVNTFDNLHLLIPNSKLLENTLINWTHGGTLIRTHVPFSVAYGSDLRAAMEIALRIANEHPEVSQVRPPDVWLTEMGDSSVKFNLLVWVDMVASVRPRVVTQLFCSLADEFASAGIEMPFPQRDLHLRSGVPWEELLTALRDRGGEEANGRISPARPETVERHGNR